MPFGCITQRDVEDIDPSEATVHNMVTYLVAGSFNISHCKRINRRKWSDFTETEQRQYLFNTLTQALTKYPAFTLRQYVYEKCPHMGQQHVHFTLQSNSTTDFYMIHDFIEKKCGLPEKFKYKTIVLKEINAVNGWTNYIHKDV